MSPNDLAQLLLKLLEEYTGFYQTTTTGGSVGTSIRATLNGRIIEAEALTNCNPGNVGIIHTRDNKYYAISEQVNINLFTNYIRYRQRRSRPRVYTADVTNTNYNVPILFSKEEVKVPILYKRSKEEFGDAAILFHTVQSYPGPHPDELCHCSYWVPTANACVKTCSGTGEFVTKEGCDEARNNRRPGSFKIYHTTGPSTSRNDGLPYFASKLNLNGLYHPPYNLAAEGPMFIIKSGGLDMQGYDYFTQRFFRNESSGRVFYEWYNLNIYYVGTQKYYFRLSGNTIVQSFKTINQNENWMNSYPGMRFPYTIPTQPYTVTGQVWQLGWDYHYFPTRLQATDPPIPPPPISNSDPAWRNYKVPGWYNRIPWGNVTGWYEEVLNINPPPLPTWVPPIVDSYSGRYMTIKYYVGGHTETPIYLGEYLAYYNSSVDPQSPTSYNSGQDAYESDLSAPGDSELGSLSRAYIVAIGEKEYEVVIKYGGSAKYEDIYSPFGGSGTRIRNLYWCKIDVFKIKNNQVSKTTYDYPQEVQLSENNWMRLFLANWNKYTFRRSSSYPYYEINPIGDNRRQPSELFFNANDTYGTSGFISLGMTNIEHCVYLTRLLYWHNNPGTRLPKYYNNNPPTKAKIIGAEAGRLNLKNKVLNDYNVNFVIDSNNPTQSYAVDCDGNQWIDQGLFINEIKSKTLTNVPIKVGKVKAEFYKYENYYANPPEFGANIGYEQNNPLAFQSGGTAYLSKVFSLNTPLCGIKQIVSWMSPQKIETTTKPFYSYLIKLPFSKRVGEDGTQLIGIYTFDSKSIDHKFKTFVDTNYNYGYYHYSNLTLNAPKTNSGWHYYGADLTSNISTSGNITIPMVLKDGQNNIVATINSSVVISPGSSNNTPFTPDEYATLLYKRVLIVGICGL